MKVPIIFACAILVFGMTASAAPMPSACFYRSPPVQGVQVCISNETPVQPVSVGYNLAETVHLGSTGFVLVKDSEGNAQTLPAVWLGAQDPCYYYREYLSDVFPYCEQSDILERLDQEIYEYNPSLSSSIVYCLRSGGVSVDVNNDGQRDYYAPAALSANAGSC